MEVLYPRCAGLDVHKDTVVAHVRCVSEPRHSQRRRFGTTTLELLALGDWLEEHGCTHAAMEATGVYWRPVWHLLEDRVGLVLANAQHIKNLPGRKSDVSDAMWIANLLAHGLIRSSFVPPAPIQELRELTRTRKQLVREVSQHSLRLQKVLETANIKLSSVLSDVLGVSGRAMLSALIAGESDPVKLAALAKGQARRQHDALVEALSGRVTPHHRRMLRLHLDLIATLEQALGEIDGLVGKALEPVCERVGLLTTVPGISHITAWIIVAEIGLDMTRFPTAGHLVSWGGLCPRNEESAGKRRSVRIRNSGTWPKTAMVLAAWPAIRRKSSYLHALYHRIRARRGAKKAIVAVAASMLTAVYYILRDGVPYRDLGPAHFDQHHREKVIRRLLRRLADLGVQLPANAEKTPMNA